MFHNWDSFYLLIGSAAGALLGLMFVVATLTAGIESSEVSRGAQVYITPIVFHFAVVVFVSVVSAVPGIPAPAVGVLLAVCAASGFAYCIATTIRICGPGWQSTPHWSDKWFYGIVPAIVYIGLVVAALSAVWRTPDRAAYGIGAVMVALLLIGIRNAWDLATFIVQRTRRP